MHEFFLATKYYIYGTFLRVTAYLHAAALGLSILDTLQWLCYVTKEGFPEPRGPLSLSMPPHAISRANREVQVQAILLSHATILDPTFNRNSKAESESGFVGPFRVR